MTKKHKGAQGNTDERSHTSRRPSRAPSPAQDHEVLYASPGAAKRAFRVEREDNPGYRRCPTPHVSQSRRVASHASLRTVDTARESGSGGSGNLSAETVTPFTGGLERYDPDVNVEIITGPLGRKQPKHRTLLPGMLRPALRSVTRLDQEPQPQAPQPSRPVSPYRRSFPEKPLPSRPMSTITSGVNKLMRMTSRPPAAIVTAPAPPALSRSHSRSSVYSSISQRANPISNLFSSLSIGSPSPSSRYRRPRELLLPADNLSDYLRLAEVPAWDRWPPDTDDAKWALFGGLSDPAVWKNTKTGWEWLRRLEAAKQDRLRGRSLKSWEGADRDWEKDLLDFLESNVPHYPVPSATRWGNQIFALHAAGFDTVEYYDEDASRSEDFGLLSWLNGSVLQTALSAVHMLREASSVFAFHVIPCPRPDATFEPRQDHHRVSATYLWEGFGTMVLVNRHDETDRAMALVTRPPSILSSNVLREFTSTGRTASRDGWRHLARDFAETDIGQANLLQAQVYDECARNQVYFFAVTNFKQWVFGSFNSTYTKASVGPVVDRKSRDPSVMQCLTACLLRSFDSRPRRHPDDGLFSHRLCQSSGRSRLRRRGSQGLRSDVTPPYPGLPRPRTPSRRSDDDVYDADLASRRGRSRHTSAPPPMNGPGDWGQQPTASSSLSYPADPYYDVPQSAHAGFYPVPGPSAYQSHLAWTGHEFYPAQAMYTASPVPAYSAHPEAYADPRWGWQQQQQQINHSRSWTSQGARY